MESQSIFPSFRTDMNKIYSDVLFRLEHTHFRDRSFFNSINDPSGYDRVSRIIEYAEAVGVNLRSQKTMDLGSGHGFVLAAFSLKNFPIYGVEKNPEVAKESRKILGKIHLPQQPEVIVADYYSNDFYDTRFSDGIGPSDADLFYCYSYTRKHAERVLATTLAGENKAKNGSLVYLNSWWDAEDDELLEQLGFERMHNMHRSSTPWIRKVDSIALDPRFVDSFNYEKNS